MHAEALRQPALVPDGGWGRPVTLAAVVHLLVLAVFLIAWLWSPRRNVELAAGSPALEASLDVSASDAAAARQALQQTPQQSSDAVPEPPTPQSVPEPVPEDTVPPPQPIPEPKPQIAPTPQQAKAQERVVQPDKVDQDRVSALAISRKRPPRNRKKSAVRSRST